MFCTPRLKATDERLWLTIDLGQLRYKPRGYPVGTHLGDIVDIPTGRRYRATQAPCGLKNCNCDVWVEELPRLT